MESEKLLILVATMTGTALMAAEDIAEYCSENNIETKIIEIDNTDIKVLTEVKSPVLICSSTYGQGDVPDSAQNFYNKLKELSPNLNHIRYALFGLGDMTYRDTFAYGGKKFTDLLDSLNATKIGDPFYHDASDGTLPEEVAVDWFVNNIKEYI
jgi:MioC protein